MGVIAVGILLGGIVMGVIAMGLLLWGILLWESLLWGYCYGVLLCTLIQFTKKMERTVSGEIFI